MFVRNGERDLGSSEVVAMNYGSLILFCNSSVVVFLLLGLQDMYINVCI